MLLPATCAAVAFLAVHFWAKVGLCQGDPWYQDLSTHWARPYVHVLWLEKVCDGQLYYYTDDPVAWYYPDSVCTRAQLVVLLCKTFSLPPVSPALPSYPDVPTNYKFLGKPGYAWIEGALLGGIAFVPKGQPFFPSNAITREDAVELLIRSLDLEELAQSMSEAEVLSLLKTFRDYNEVSPNRRHSMACAIKFGIIDGYTDWTIRPTNSMLRGEAAAVVYRSCLIRVDAIPDEFSPDGDGVDDTVLFRLGYLRNRGIKEWQMVIRDSADKEVYRFNPSSAPGYPPTELVWDGHDSRGYAVPEGSYSYQAWVLDRNNNQFFSIKKPLKIIRHSLSAKISPIVCHDGDTLTLNVSTSPEATLVKAVFADGVTRNLIPIQGNTRWRLTLIAGPFLPPGFQEVIVTAQFPKAIRQQTISFTHIKNLWITPSLSPNPCGAGQPLGLSSGASDGITSVEVTLLGESASLAKDGMGQWQGSIKIPVTTPVGPYPVIFVGKDGTDSVSEEIVLVVTESAAVNLRYILTR